MYASSCQSTSNKYSSVTPYTELFSKYGTSAVDISTVPSSTLASLAASSTWYFASGAYVSTGTADKTKIEAASTSASASGFASDYSYRLTQGQKTDNILHLPVDGSCTVTVYWLNNGNSARGLDVAATKGTFSDNTSTITKMTGNTSELTIADSISTDKARIAAIATGTANSDKGYIVTTFKYTGTADELKLINSSAAATETLKAGGGGIYIYAVDVAYGD